MGDTPQDDRIDQTPEDDDPTAPDAFEQGELGTAHGYTTKPRQGLENAARAVSGAGGRTTMFQPGAMIDDILTEPGEESGTRVIDGEPRPPRLQLENAPYFLVVGAAPGEERLPILHARTTFGRDRGDIQLVDRSISSLHFQLDVVGHEFFVRDLGSRNGTRLNGHPVRYAEILPGDEVQAGETTLIFRVENDGLDRRRESH